MLVHTPNTPPASSAGHDYASEPSRRAPRHESDNGGARYGNGERSLPARTATAASTRRIPSLNVEMRPSSQSCRAQICGCWLAGTRPMAASISTSEAADRKTGSRCMSSQCRSADFCDKGAGVANKGVSISQVFNAFSPVGYLGSSRNANPDDRGEQGLAEFACVRTALCLGRLLDGGNHSDGLAIIGEHSGLTLRGGSGEL
jgi:hypothetical protein